jgi:hypothetical protein
VPASVEAVHVSEICVADSAVAVRPEGTVGAVVSGGAGAGGGGLGVDSPPVPPQPLINASA